MGVESVDKEVAVLGFLSAWSEWALGIKWRSSLLNVSWGPGGFPTGALDLKAFM